jgi:hypothetical protein
MKLLVALTELFNYKGGVFCIIFSNEGSWYNTVPQRDSLYKIRNYYSFNRAIKKPIIPLGHVPDLFLGSLTLYVLSLMGTWEIITGKNCHARRATHREAVFGTVIHSIFDAWHYEVLWTCTLTWLLWYACDYVHLILYIILHSTNLKPSCQMHFIARSQVHLRVHSQVHSRACSQVRFQLHSMAHSQPAWLYAPK